MPAIKISTKQCFYRKATDETYNINVIKLDRVTFCQKYRMKKKKVNGFKVGKLCSLHLEKSYNARVVEIEASPSKHL